MDRRCPVRRRRATARAQPADLDRPAAGAGCGGMTRPVRSYAERRSLRSTAWPLRTRSPARCCGWHRRGRSSAAAPCWTSTGPRTCGPEAWPSLLRLRRNLAALCCAIRWSKTPDKVARASRATRDRRREPPSATRVVMAPRGRTERNHADAARSSPAKIGGNRSYGAAAGRYTSRSSTHPRLRVATTAVPISAGDVHRPATVTAAAV